MPRMLRSAIIALTRVCDAPWLAAWCAADPGPVTVKLWVPALRSSTRVPHRVRDTMQLPTARRAVQARI